MRVATENERDAHFRVRLDTLLTGDNLMSFKLDKTVIIKISDDEKEALLARSKKIATNCLDVELFWNGLFTQTDTSELTKKENKMRNQKTVTITLHFRHFVCPVDDGAWQKPNVKNPLFRAWQEFFGPHEKYIMCGANQQNLRLAHDQSLSIDIAFAKYNNKILRFHLLEPFPEHQKGVQVFVKTKK